MSASIEITPEFKSITKILDFMTLHAPKQSYLQNDALLLLRIMREQGMKKIRVEFVDATWNVTLLFKDQQYTGACTQFWTAFNIAHDSYEAHRARAKMN